MPMANGMFLILVFLLSLYLIDYEIKIETKPIPSLRAVAREYTSVILLSKKYNTHHYYYMWWYHTRVSLIP